VDHRIKDALGAMNLASKDQIEKLSEKIEKLSEKIEILEKQRSGGKGHELVHRVTSPLG
jgi:polyhydroxyalkanoate synthesis regulator phasin